MMTAQISTYPGYRQQVEDLVNQHLELVEEPLHLAIYYAPDRDENDVFLFEVIGNFDGSSIRSDGDLFEVLYGPTPDFKLPNDDAKLHIILANPEELREAAANRTEHFQELKQALTARRAQIIYRDQQGNDLEQVFQ